MSVKATTDLSSVFAGLDALNDIKTSLARSMGVAGGQIVRDEAKARAPVGETGNLKRSIYLAYKDATSTESVVVYSVSWNSKIAPHGHLVEFGHAIVKGGKAGRGGQNIGWVPAKPFLRPAYEASVTRIGQAMIDRGRERLAELLREMYTPDDGDFV